MHKDYIYFLQIYLIGGDTPHPLCGILMLSRCTLMIGGVALATLLFSCNFF